LAKEIQKFQRKDQNFVLGVTFWGKTPSMGISSQNSLLNNFSPVQRIPTRNKPMDSAQLAETQGIIKNFPYSILGEQSGNFKKITP
jgi:hypothetical protein